jgi:hypothetical protein
VAARSKAGVAAQVFEAKDKKPNNALEPMALPRLSANVKCAPEPRSLEGLCASWPGPGSSLHCSDSD